VRLWTTVSGSESLQKRPVDWLGMVVCDQWFGASVPWSGVVWAAGTDVLATRVR
jgi:hypothetical protein